MSGTRLTSMQPQDSVLSRHAVTYTHGASIRLSTRHSAPYSWNFFNHTISNQTIMLRKIRRKIAHALHGAANSLFRDPKLEWNGDPIEVPKFIEQHYITRRLDCRFTIERMEIMQFRDPRHAQRMRAEVIERKITENIMRKAIEIGALEIDSRQDDFGNELMTGTMYVCLREGRDI